MFGKRGNEECWDDCECLVYEGTRGVGTNYECLVDEGTRGICGMN